VSDLDPGYPTITEQMSKVSVELQILHAGILAMLRARDAEIERLRAALLEISEMDWFDANNAPDIAAKALAPPVQEKL
jgi:hypothetical protein